MRRAWSLKKRDIGTCSPCARRSSVSTEGETNPRSMRESIEEEIPEVLASTPADTSAAMRSALTCAPMRNADRLRTTGAGCRSGTLVTETGSRRGRAVGKGEAICRRVI
ncbi:hypothetical protein GmRootV213_05780 [Variovorax sp. V213]